MKRISASLFPPIALEPDHASPLYRQLYDWFRGAILKGQLRPGQRVPSTRSLAAELKVSRIPVLSAFEQLHAEGYLQTAVGSGTFVARSIPDEIARLVTDPVPLARNGNPGREKERPGKDNPHGVKASGTRNLSIFGTEALAAPTQPWLNNLGAFRVSLPALDHFPVEVWSRLVARHSRVQSRQSMAYGDTMGLMPFRSTIAEYLGTVRGVRCTPEQVMVVTGSQQGLQICARVLLDPGDHVWIEEPGYPGAHQALVMTGARLVPIPVDDQGLDVEAGIGRCTNARAVYVTPSHQYPMGMTMSAARRMLLLQWAVRTGAWIIEDDYDSEYRFGSRPIASLQGLDEDARVIYIGTFSKVLFPALRLGYVIVPKDLAPAFAAAREAGDIFSSTLYQAVLTDFIQQGHFGRHIRRMRMLYMERRDLLLQAIGRYMGELLEVVSAEAGMHLVALLPPEVEDIAVSSRAAEIGISALPLSSCYLERPSRGGLVLGYGGTDARQIQAGVRKLAGVLDVS